MLKEIFKLVGGIVASVLAFTVVSILAIIAIVYMAVDILSKL